MFGSSILEIAIGLIFIYLLFSLICTAINEQISALLNKRGENLFDGIRNLLNDPAFTGLAQKLYNHGLVDGISQANKNPNKPGRRPSYIDNGTFALALLDNLGSLKVLESWRLISEQCKTELETARAKLSANPRDVASQKAYSEAKRAAEKAQEQLKKGDEFQYAYEEANSAAQRVSSPRDVANLRAARERLDRALAMGRFLVGELPDPLNNIQLAIDSLPGGHTKQSLSVLVEKTKRDASLVSQSNNPVYEMAFLQENIEEWFDDAMDRVSGWYKRWSQKVLLVTSILLVLAANADSVMMVRRLARDNNLRATVVAAADAAVQDQQSRDELLEEAAKLTLPVGWFPDKKNDQYWREQVPDCKSDDLLSDCLGGWAVKLFGLLMTVLAIQLGAPFWFDTLSKFVNIRSAGTPPGESAKSSPQSTRNTVVDLATALRDRPNLGTK
jgi:hypothetical protein